MKKQIRFCAASARGATLMLRVVVAAASVARPLKAKVLPLLEPVILRLSLTYRLNQSRGRHEHDSEAAIDQLIAGGSTSTRTLFGINTLCWL